MYVIKQAGLGLATMGDLKNRAKQTLEAVKDARIYVLNDGKPVAGLVSLDIMDLVEEILEDRELARVAAARHAAIESGEEQLIEEGEFFAAADAKMAARGAIAAQAQLAAAKERRDAPQRSKSRSKPRPVTAR